jgi:lipopolysaccharide transport system ATP-binding protein
VYDRPFDRLKEMVLRRPCHQIVHALHPLSFDVLRGQCVGVVGANGAGKTTLLSLLTGTLAPSTGSIEVFGRVSAILGLGVGMLPTHTGRENIRHGLITRGIAPDLHEQLEREIIDFSELGAAIDHAVSTYSSGMAMRLNFSIAHAVEPDILIVDEALAVGDARFTFKCQKKMREFLDRGKTLFFVSHNLATVRELCDHGLLLDKGRLLCAGDVADVLRQYQLLYFGEAVAVRQAHNSRQQAQWGRDDIDIASVDVQGADATPDGTWAVAQGNPIELTVRVRVRQPVPWPGIGIIVTTGYGMRVSGFSTANHIDPLPPLPPGEFTFRYRMPTYLQAGDYRLELILADMSSAPPRLLGIWDSLLRLRVQWNDYLVQGLVDCGAEIELAGQWMSMDRERRRRLGRRQPINL